MPFPTYDPLAGLIYQQETPIQAKIMASGTSEPSSQDGSNELWGEMWTPENINADNFGEE